MLDDRAYRFVSLSLDKNFPQQNYCKLNRIGKNRIKFGICSAFITKGLLFSHRITQRIFIYIRHTYTCICVRFWADVTLILYFPGTRLYAMRFSMNLRRTKNRFGRLSTRANAIQFPIQMVNMFFIFYLNKCAGISMCIHANCTCKICCLYSRRKICFKVCVWCVYAFLYVFVYVNAKKNTISSFI